MGSIFNTIVTQPLYNMIVGFYDIIPGDDLGLAIIATTIVVKGVLSAFTFKSLKAQKQLREVQPKIAEIKERYKDDKEEQAKQLMAVYKEHNVNPFATCLPLLIQLPIFLALFRMLRNGFAEVNGDLLYGFISNPGTIDQTFLGLIDLTAISIPLAVLTAAAQYIQMKQTIQQQPPKKIANKNDNRIYPPL